MEDAHNHLQSPQLAPHRKAIIEQAASHGLTRMVINGTHPEDWAHVADLARQHPTLIHPSFGLHPWHITPLPPDWLDQLEQWIHQFTPLPPLAPTSHHIQPSQPIVGLGECGLDRWKDPSPSALDQQLPLFRAQCKLAAKHNLPLTIHCLQAWGPLRDTLKSTPLPPRGFLLHSYSGSIELARELCSLGAYFSFSGYFLHPRKERVREVYRQLPADRLLLETDAPAMLPPSDYQISPTANPTTNSETNSPLNLPQFLKPLAQLRKTSPQALQNTLHQNYHRFFCNTPPA